MFLYPNADAPMSKLIVPQHVHASQGLSSVLATSLSLPALQSSDTSGAISFHITELGSVGLPGIGRFSLEPPSWKRLRNAWMVDLGLFTCVRIWLNEQFLFARATICPFSKSDNLPVIVRAISLFRLRHGMWPLYSLS